MANVDNIVLIELLNLHNLMKTKFLYNISIEATAHTIDQIILRNNIKKHKLMKLSKVTQADVLEMQLTFIQN
jgi:hypothetical protein